MTAFWCVVWRKLPPPAAASSFPTRPRTSRKRAKSSPLAVHEGDRILFGKYSGTEIKIDGEEFIIMKEDEVLGVLTGTTTGSKKELAGSKK
jgi:Chaperonin 10 Kd subunit